MLSKRIILPASLAMLLAANMPLRADDGDAKASPKEEKARSKAAEKTENEKFGKTKEEHGGNMFTRFWIHTVGGTIGNGLKGGADKIHNGI
jgi:hypothetical protein